MRRTFILAVIACVLGIVILGALAFYIPGRLGNTSNDNESELFTGFAISDESSKNVDSSISGSDQKEDSSSEETADSSAGGTADLSEGGSHVTGSDVTVSDAADSDAADSDATDSDKVSDTIRTDDQSADEKTSSSPGSSDKNASKKDNDGKAGSGKNDNDKNSSDKDGSNKNDSDKGGNVKDDNDSSGQAYSVTRLTEGDAAPGETQNAEGTSSFVPAQRQTPEGTAASVKKHQIIWVGDSRTLGLRDALRKTERKDDDVFVGKVGEGVHWFQEEGIGELADMIEQYPDLPVVMNLGVNDPQLINEYVVTYWDVIEEWPDTDFYILSVNPIDEEFLIEDGLVDESVFTDINSLNVARMNVKLKSEFGSRYIDSASYLKSDGFETVDGLHFSTSTYLKIHDFVVNILF